MGRKRAEPEIKRTAQTNVMLRQAEMALLADVAAMHGVPVATLARMLVLRGLGLSPQGYLPQVDGAEKDCA